MNTENTFGPKEAKPMAYRRFDVEGRTFLVIPSGWSQPQKYHLIIEHGETGEVENRLVDANYLLAIHGINVKKTDFAGPLVIDYTDVGPTPNDMDLGRNLRKKFYANLNNQSNGTF